MAKMTVDFHVTQVRIIFFPVATLTVCGEVAKLTVFGIPVFRRAGQAKSLFGIVWKGRG